jgi:O-antigen/teichoic acid export membrane protein
MSCGESVPSDNTVVGDDTRGKSSLGLAAGSGLTFAAQLLLFVLSMGTGVLTARLLGPEGKGVYSLLILAFTLSTLVFGAGGSQFAACFAGKGRYSTGAVLLNGLFMSAIGSGLAWIIVIAVVVSGPAVLPSEWQVRHVVLLAGLLPFGLLAAYTQSLLQGVDRMVAFNLMRVISPLATLVLLLIALIGFGAGLEGAIAAWVVGQIVTAVWGWLAARRYLADKGAAWTKLMAHSFQFGLSALVSLIIGTLNQRFDLFLVGAFCGNAGAGYYSVATSLSMLLWYLPASMAIALVPKLAVASRERGGEIAARACRMALAASILGAIGAAVVVTPLVPIVYGAEYRPSVPAFLLLLPGTAIFGVVHITTGYFMSALNRPLINSGLAGLSLIIDVLLNMILTPRWGVSGAAVSSTVSYCLSTGVALLVFARLSKTRLRDILIPRRGDWGQYGVALCGPLTDFRVSLARVLRIRM